jgi:crotonobetainyl-CoA:carnitine CoA-transferase CaiB-like acyl-CoA transferase
MAVSLARPDDVELLGAWLEIGHSVDAPRATDDVWALVERAVESRAGAELRERATLLGLPAAPVGSDAASRPPVVTTAGTTPRRARSVDGALVVDLSSLWAGPLCGQLLAEQGARVVKVESTGRPDGARQGDPGFFALLNGAKRSVAVDLTSSAGRSMLGALLRRADLVIEASRPRALDHLGLGAEHHLAGGWAGVWVSITGYGRSGADATRAAFGDDAAAAGGLVVWEGDEPRFCADAAADPLTGLAAATACLEALATDGTWLLDVSMAAVAADAAGPTVAAPAGVNAAPPRSRPIAHEAAPLGADTAAVLGELAIAP